MVEVLLAVLFIAGFVALMVYVVRAQQRSNVAEVDRLGRALGLPVGSPFLVERHGRTFTARFAPAYKSTPASLTVITPVDETAEAAPGGAYRESGRAHVAVRPRIVFRPESVADRLAHRLGVNREVKTGDAAFDGAVYIVTDSPEEDVQRTLASPELREAVRALLAAGATHVQLNFEGLTAMLVGPPPYADRFEPIAKGLAQAAGALPLFQPGTAPRGPSVIGLVIASLTGLFTMVSVPVVALTQARPPLAGSPVLVGVGSGLALWTLATLAARWRLRGRSTSLALILIFAIWGLFVFPAGTYWAVCWANQALDTSPAVDHPTTVKRGWFSRAQPHYSYYVEVVSWRPGHATEEIPVSFESGGNVAGGHRAVVTTRAGKLGWEWVEGFHLTK